MAYTTREENLLTAVKRVMPAAFIVDAGDDKLLGFIDLVVNDINWWLPHTNYNVRTFPDGWFQTIVLGTNVFAQMFKQMEATLQDFDYNDNGLSVRVDQVGKINIAMANMIKVYSEQIKYIKRAMMLGMGVGLGTPRFQSCIGQFLKIALGSSFAWNSVPSGGTGKQL
jgi:hypothetical protein